MTQPQPGAPSGTPDPSAQGGAPVGDGTATPATPPEGAPSGTTPPAPVTPPATVSQEEFDRIRTQLQAADRKREQAQQELQAIRDKDLPEIERLKRDNAAATEQVNRLTGQLKDQAVELAFLRDNKVKWKDSAAALKLLDRSQIQVGDDGSVEGVKLAAEKLAKQYPFMVDDAKPEGTPAGGTPPAGGAPPMNGKSGTENTGTKGLVNRLPALASRRRPTQQQ